MSRYIIQDRASKLYFNYFTELNPILAELRSNAFQYVSEKTAKETLSLLSLYFPWLQWRLRAVQ